LEVSTHAAVEPA